MTEILAGNPFFASCLLASLLLAGWRAVARNPQISWAHALFPPLWSVASTVVLGASALLLPLTFDRYLYTVDGSFGFQPAFSGARLLLANPWLLHTCAVCYFNLPLGMAVMYLLLLRKRGTAAANAFVRFAVVLGVAGTCLYFLCPAVGPGGAFVRDFPNRIPAVTLLVPLAMPMAARNCMPSLHTAWILCLLWSAPPMGRWARAALWAFSGFTLLYALSAGGHYLVDLVVAVPFSEATRLIAVRRWKSLELLQNAAFVAVWLVLVRFGAGIWSLSYAVPYGFSALTVVAPFFPISRIWADRPAPDSCSDPRPPHRVYS